MIRLSCECLQDSLFACATLAMSIIIMAIRVVVNCESDILFYWKRER